MRDKDLENKVARIAREFKKLRLEQGLSQAKLAELTGLSDRAIAMIENNKRTPTILTCLKICKALNVRLAEIIGN